MKNEYHRDIMEILLPEGTEGMPVRVIARLVYNRHTGLFADDLTFDKVYHCIRFYLWHQSQRPSSPFCQCPRRGWYAIKSSLGVQMDLCFEERDIPESSSPPVEIPSPPIPFSFD